VHPDQVRKLVRKWIIPVVAITLIGAVIAFFVSKSLTPIYEAKGDVLVLAGPGQSVGGDVNLNATEATTTAATLLTQRPLLQEIINSLQLNVTTEALARQVSAVARSNTELVAVTVRDPSAQNAATIANAIMSAYVSGVTALGTVSVAVPAAAPLSPASPSTSVNTALGAAGGLVFPGTRYWDRPGR
jgi:succinoglycan biosynthesis transport protein ExoP